MPHIVGHFVWFGGTKETKKQLLERIETTNTCVCCFDRPIIIDPEKPEGFLGNQTPITFPGTLARLKNENTRVCIYREVQHLLSKCPRSWTFAGRDSHFKSKQQKLFVPSQYYSYEDYLIAVSMVRIVGRININLVCLHLLAASMIRVRKEYQCCLFTSPSKI